MAAPGAFTPAPAPATAGNSLKERLAVLKSMLDDGLITEAEFEDRKNRILDEV